VADGLGLVTFWPHGLAKNTWGKKYVSR
jgi:hypothetical protein